MKFGGLIAILLLILGTTPTLSETTGEDWGYADLTKLIQDKQHSGQALHSVDDLLSAMPPGLRNHFTFVYDTHNRFQEASPTYPRAIAFGQKLLFAFNGHPSQKGYQTLELVEFKKAGRRFELHEISFKNHQAKLSTPNPAKCLECHGADPKPIWFSYPVWPGVYGSDDDILDPQEKENYKKFLAAMRASPESRYAKLNFSDQSAVFPYREDYGGIKSENFRINLVLSQLLTAMNAQRVARLLEESPYYRNLNWILPEMVGAYRYDGDESTSQTCRLPDKFAKRLLPWLREILARELPHRKLSTSLGDATFLALGLPVDRVTMEQGSTTFEFEDGTQKLLSNVRVALIRSLAAQDPEFAWRLEIYSDANRSAYSAYPLYRHIDTIVGGLRQSNEPLYCGYLREKVEAQFKELDKNGLPETAQLPQDKSFGAQLQAAERYRISPLIPVSCVFCHTVQTEAPRIPFNDAQKLKAALTADNGYLLEQILKRTEPLAPKEGKMPPANREEFAELGAGDYERLKKFLRDL